MFESMTDSPQNKNSSQKSSKKTPAESDWYTRKDISETEVVFEISIPGKEYDDRYKKELEKVGKTTEIKGFRPGKAPADMVEQKYGAEARQKALELVVSEYVTKAFHEENIFPALSPQVQIKNTTDAQSVNIEVTVPVIPEFKLPDLTTLDTRKQPVGVDDKEVDEVLKRIWQEHRGKYKDKSAAWVKEIAPKLGFTAQTVVELKQQIRDAIQKEKQRIMDQEYAREVLAEAITKAKITIPEKLVEHEVAERERSFQNSLEQLKMSEEDFCKSKNVTMEQLREQWEKDAREAIETDVLLGAYIREHKVKVMKEELEAEIEIMKQQAKDPSDSMFDNEEWRGYIERVLLKRKAYQAFLEKVSSRGGSKSGGAKKK